jgi:N6-L-threonylcarbamoyladenine synthase
VRTLGIETSCDDTAVALLEGSRVLAERRITQEAHRRYLGVVPELASREHLSLVFPLIDETLGAAGRSLDEVEAVAVTCGPGLVGCLLVGVSVAKALSHALGVPLVGVNHIHAHAFSAFLDREPAAPFLAMVVSGGHSEIFRVASVVEVEPLGSTLDDAAGEAFDKVAKLLGLGYPGGVEIDRRAERGNPTAFAFPRAMLGPESLDVSFSGLKTAVRQTVERAQARNGTFVDDVCASFQRAVVDVLVAKLERAADRYAIREWTVAGGVACNSELRSRLAELATRRGARLTMPEPEYCGDNAVMVARLGERLLESGWSSAGDLPVAASLEELDRLAILLRN